jgi:radical SAM protein with 4Fe4S-binding SPASM domain
MGTHSQVGSHRVHQSSRFLAEHGYLEVPSLVQWLATLKCGLSCRHCLAVSHESGFDDMPLEKVRSLIDEVAVLGVREFLLTGGEPLAREDLAEVIEYLGRKRMNWTLNTATLPSEDLRQVIARNRPGFVAVSLDGPREVHDAFRGRAGAWEAATEAIRFFKLLTGVRVCAGTTVTSRNYDYLAETFHLVAASGADQWGIHLLVPEGRAAERPDLFLSRKQLKRLLQFVARKRRYFRVEMADEIGYLGYLEPLVRDWPLQCGAGRSQCVVLPDGEVVPCTTLDRSCSAGNLYDRSFADIWANGFQDLRTWRPEGRCGGCDYSAACRGGCWLQRKAGTQCFRDVWHVPGALKTAAGIAICLGGLATSHQAWAADAVPASASTLAEAEVEEIVPPQTEPGAELIAVAQALSLDDAVMGYYVQQATGTRAQPVTGIDPNEPGWRFFLDFQQSALPADISGCCTAVCNALETQQQSLSLAALLWRAVSEPLFDPNSATVHSPAEREAIRNTLAALSLKAQQWRLKIFEENLDPYLTGGRTTAPLVFMYTKGGQRVPHDVEHYYLSKDLNEERWGVGANPDSREAAEAYLNEHRYADQMDLTFTVHKTRGGKLTRYHDGETEIVSPPVEGSVSSCTATMRLFDVFEVSGNVSLSMVLEGDVRAILLADPNYVNLLDDQGEKGDLSVSLSATLEDGRQYTYVELLNTIYQQQKDTLLTMAYDWVQGDSLSAWNQNVEVIVATHKNGALLWPAFREIIAATSVTQPVRRILAEASADPEVHHRAILKDIDFWMF